MVKEIILHLTPLPYHNPCFHVLHIDLIVELLILDHQLVEANKEIVIVMVDSPWANGMSFLTSSPGYNGSLRLQFCWLGANCLLMASKTQINMNHGTFSDIKKWSEPGRISFARTAQIP